MYKSRLIVPTLFLWVFFTSHTKSDDQNPSFSNNEEPAENLDTPSLMSDSTEPVKVFEYFNENCEVQRPNFIDNSSYECMSCTIIVSPTPIQAKSVELSMGEEFESFLYRFKLETEMRFVCPGLKNPDRCEVRPVFIIKKKPGQNLPSAQAPIRIEGFEIGIDHLDTNASRIFLELDIDHTMFERLGYPDIVVEYVPTYTFEPSSRYQISLSTLPKLQSRGLDAWDELKHVKTPEIPSQDYLNSLTNEQTGHWHKKRLLCTDEVWCYQSEYCSMGPYGMGEEHKGVVKSFIIAVSVCFLILWFFVVLVTLARNRVRRLNRHHGDTEYLYDDGDDLFDDDDGLPKRTNDTEMLDLSKQQQQFKSPSKVVPETSVRFKDTRQNMMIGGTGTGIERSASHGSGDMQSARIEVNNSGSGNGALNSLNPKHNEPETLVANGISLQFATTNID